MGGIHATVTFPGGDGFSNEIDDFAVRTESDTLELNCKNGDKLLVGGNVGWFISDEREGLTNE